MASLGKRSPYWDNCNALPTRPAATTTTSTTTTAMSLKPNPQTSAGTTRTRKTVPDQDQERELSERSRKRHRPNEEAIDQVENLAGQFRRRMRLDGANKNKRKPTPSSRHWWSEFQSRRRDPSQLQPNEPLFLSADHRPLQNTSMGCTPILQSSSSSSSPLSLSSAASPPHQQQPQAAQTYKNTGKNASSGINHTIEPSLPGVPTIADFSPYNAVPRPHGPSLAASESTLRKLVHASKQTVHAATHSLLTYLQPSPPSNLSLSRPSTTFAPRSPIPAHAPAICTFPPSTDDFRASFQHDLDGVVAAADREQKDRIRRHREMVLWSWSEGEEMWRRRQREERGVTPVQPRLFTVGDVPAMPPPR
ncbi:hypothetical protein K402DRAFT_424408, partial [Aulographum hederae CBS 113979]